MEEFAELKRGEPRNAMGVLRTYEGRGDVGGLGREGTGFIMLQIIP